MSYLHARPFSSCGWRCEACLLPAPCSLLLQYTTKMPPKKRAKGNSPAAQLQKQHVAASAHRTIGGKPGQR
jgi:hypothetical protein